MVWYHTEGAIVEKFQNVDPRSPYTQVLDESISYTSLESSISEQLSHTPTTQSHHTPTHTATFPTYTPSPTTHLASSETSQPRPQTGEGVSTTAIPEHSEATASAQTAGGLQGQDSMAGESAHRADTPKTPSSDSTTMKKLKNLSSADAERGVCYNEGWH